MQNGLFLLVDIKFQCNLVGRMGCIAVAEGVVQQIEIKFVLKPQQYLHQANGMGIILY